MMALSPSLYGLSAPLPWACGGAGGSEEERGTQHPLCRSRSICTPSQPSVDALSSPGSPPPNFSDGPMN